VLVTVRDVGPIAVLVTILALVYFVRGAILPGLDFLSDLTDCHQRAVPDESRECASMALKIAPTDMLTERNAASE
jgi:hypothetical protein